MMRERLGTLAEGGEPKPEVHKFERRTVTSLLEGPNGEHPEVTVAISKQDGELRFTNFWDLDKTLLFAEPIHFAAVERIYPGFARSKAEAEKLHHFYVDGFKLGNSFREWDRMRRICEEGRVQYEDAAIYERDFMDNPEIKKLIDEPGHKEQYHEKANEVLQRYGRIAYAIMEEKYNQDPVGFQKTFVLPAMIQLLQQKSRLGQANVFMTANQSDFAKGLVKFSGVYQYGLALAPDEKMKRGGKEVAIERLIEELGELGLKVNRTRAAAIGDSIKGDVGSGTKTNLSKGILVAETSADIASIRERAQQETVDGRQIKSILDKTEVEAIPVAEVKKSKHDVYRFGQRSSQ